MELDDLDIGLYAEDEQANTILTTALACGWLPRYRKARGALFEVAFMPSEDDADDDAEDSVYPTTTASPSPPPPKDARAGVVFPPELAFTPFLAPQSAAPTLAAHLTRAHPLTDRVLARHASEPNVRLLYGWLELVPASCIVQYAEAMGGESAGLSEEEEAVLSKHLLRANHADTTATGVEASSVPTGRSDRAEVDRMPTPPPPVKTAANEPMQAPTALSRPPTTTTAEGAAGGTDTHGGDGAAPAEFFVVRGELQFRLHLWSTPHTTRAMQRHLKPTTATTSTQPSSDNDPSNASATVQHFFATRGTKTGGDGGADMESVPLPHAKELAERDDTAKIKAALDTVVKLSHVVAGHPNAKVQVFTDSSRSPDAEYITFEDA